MVVDNKTSKQKKSQDAVDDDLQMSAYSYLLAANGYVFPRAEVKLQIRRTSKTENTKAGALFHQQDGREQKTFR